MAMATALNLNELVNDAADEFERRFGLKVSSGARYELISAGELHADAIQKDLDAEKVSLGFLKEVLFEVLQNAREVAIDWDRTEIGEDTTRKSMETKCRYLGWC